VPCYSLSRSNLDLDLEDLALSGESYKHSINAIRSPATQIAYKNSLKRYLAFLKLKEVDDLLTTYPNPNPRHIESQIISYIMYLRERGIAYATIHFLVAPIFTFYQLNDVVLNRKKVSRYMGEYKRVAKDGFYNTEQIHVMSKNGDPRLSMIIHILNSTACRIGALPSLTLGNLTKLPDYGGLYKIVFYEGTNNEYYSFLSREGAQMTENYLFYRKRMGENISFNESTQRWEPANAPLIRRQFDINDLLQVRQPQPMSLKGIMYILDAHLIKCGIKVREHPTVPQSTGKIRKSVAMSKGFRKRTISLFIEAGLNHEIRELLCDHATGLDAAYFRPSEKQVLEEYLKVEPMLCVDPSIKLAQENQALRVEKNSWESLREEVNALKDLLKQG
jgi:hypothetical protein